MSIPVADTQTSIYPQEGIPVSDLPVSSTPSTGTASDRANKISSILGKDSPGVDVLTSQLSNGEEGTIRSELATQDTAYKQQKVLEDLRASAEAGNFPTMEELQRMTVVPSKPETVIEDLTASKNVDQMVAGKSDYEDLLRQAIEDNPKGTLQALDTTKKVLARNEIAKTVAQDITDQWQNTPWLSVRGITDTVSQFVPLYEWGTYLRNRSEDDSSFLTGSILERKAQELYSIQDPVEFKQKMEEEIRALAVDSYPAAVHYAQAMVSYSTSDSFLDGIFNVLDLGTFIPGGFIGKSGKVTDIELKTVLKDSLKASNTSLASNTVDVLSGVGKTEDAAIALLKEGKARFLAEDPTNISLPVRQQVRSLFNPEVLVHNPSSTTIEYSDRLTTILRANAGKFLTAYTGKASVPRLASPEALDASITEAKDIIKKTYTQAIDGLIDYRVIPAESTSYNVGQVRALFGVNDGTPFKSASEAQYWMEQEYKLSSSQYKILNENGGFYGVVDQYLPETTDSVRNALINTEARTPRTWVGQLIDTTKKNLNPRGADEILSKTDLSSRLLANTGSQNLMKAMADIGGETIGKLGKEKSVRLNRLLEIDRAFVDPDTGEQGRFLLNLDEYTAQYRSIFNEAPTEEEAAAYFTAVQLSDFDYMIRDAGLFRDMARQGIENFTFSLPEGIKSPKFKGKQVPSLPDFSEEYTLLTIGKDSLPKTFISSGLKDTDKEMINDLLASGYKIVQVYEPSIRPLQSVTGKSDIVNFVITNSWNNEKLTLGNLPYRPGGHREYMSKHYVKQARISDYSDTGKYLYEGDNVAFGFETRAEAVKYTDRMEKARQLLKEGKEKELGDYLSKNLPFRLSKFRSFFMETTDFAGNIHAPRFSIDEPFKYTPDKGRVWDTGNYKDRTDLINLADSKFNLAAESDRQFLANRDPELWTVKEVHQNGGLVHKLSSARQLDPLASITRTMRSIMEARYISDYKISSIERWISEFSDTMNVPKEELRRRPTYYFNNPEFNEKFTDKKMLAAARQSASNIKNFLGVETAIDRQVNTVTQRMLDAVYGTAGQRVSDYTSETLAKVSDPSRFFRGTAFHTNMGFFNPVQIAVQGQTAFVITAISPTHGSISSVYSVASQLTSLTKKDGILRKMEGFLDTLGLDGKVFRESRQELEKVGWDFIGGESMWSEATLTPKVHTSKVGQVLDAGTVFFKGTERFLRLTAWHTAFREFREANPGKVISNIERSQILRRANTLSVSMTNASKANWENGILSVPTQFMSYQARLMDLVWGRSLTAPEKARLLGIQAILYGLPGAGAAVTGFSAYDALRTYALDNGMDLSDTALSGVLEGIPHLVAQQMNLGEWNYSSRYGPSGFTAIQDFIDGDKTLIETLMGPSGSIFNQSIKQSSPAIWALSAAIRSDDPDMKLSAEDFKMAAYEVSKGVLRSTALGNSLFNILTAYTTGHYISRNNVVTSESSTTSALVTALTGLQPSEISDTYLLIKNKKDWQEFRKDTDKGFDYFYKRGLMAYSEGSTSQGHAYMRAAHSMVLIGRYNPQEKVKLLQQIMKSNGTLVNKIRDDYFRNPPSGSNRQHLLNNQE